MARPKSPYLSAFGVVWQIWKALTDEVLNLGGNDEDMRRVETDSELRKKIATLIVGSKQIGNIFQVTVDYTKSLAEMIFAGKYDWKNSDINENNFPSPQIPSGSPTKVVIQMELVHFNRFLSSKGALTKIKKLGLRPATLWELLAFGAKYPEKQREFSIVALGSVWQGLDSRCVPCLWSCSGARDLNLAWFGLDWREGYRFLVVRESACR